MATSNARARRQQYAQSLAPTPAVTNIPDSPNVGYVRQEVLDLRIKWRRVEDCIAGQDAIKARGIAYLPQPNSEDMSKENKARYTNYVARALFYNFTNKTLLGLVDQVFSRDPLVNIPDDMKPLIDDVDGSGVSLDQQAKKGLIRNIANGGFGLLVDYPKTDGPITLAQREQGYIRPTISQYHRGSIINWRTKKKGAIEQYTLIVLHESNCQADDGFEINYEEQWRVLRMVAGVYTMQMWRYDENGKLYEPAGNVVIPLDADGNPLDHIPFYFCGFLNNSATPDNPALDDMANLNIAHYRNSADYEDSCYLVGQPTPVFSGLTEQWVNKVFKNKPIQLGSRAAIPLPVNGTATMLQATANSMPMEGMVHKEKQAAALGARFFEPGGGANTLGQAQQDEATETSMLASAAKNVSLAYTLALVDAAKMHGSSVEDLYYSLNTDFPASRLTPNERTQTVLEWQAGAIAESEMRATLRKGGIATLDLPEYKKELAANPPPVPEKATNNAGAGGSDNQKKKNKDAQNNGGNQAQT